jgi:HEAT repeat protein
MLDFYAKPGTRAAALSAMALSGDPRFERYVREALDDPDPEVVASAIFGVAGLDMEADTPRLVPFFEDEDLRADALAAYAMTAACEPTRAGLRRLLKKIDTLARGLSEDEEDEVKDTLNTRAGRDGLEPVFDDDGEPLLDAPALKPAKVGRNDPCPCGSGKKFKKCCGA